MAEELYSKDYTLVSAENGQDMFLVRKDGATKQLTQQEKNQVEDAVSGLFLNTPLGSGVRVKGPKVFD
jgi:hypothetical protein